MLIDRPNALCPGSFPFLTQYPELTLDYWAKKFGDLYSIWLGNQLFVIVSSPAIAKDLFVSMKALVISRRTKATDYCSEGH